MSDLPYRKSRKYRKFSRGHPSFNRAHLISGISGISGSRFQNLGSAKGEG